MDNITRMIVKAAAATGEPVALAVNSYNGAALASLVNIGRGGVLGDTITLESDWNTHLTTIADTVESAIIALDAICARDFT